MKKSDQSIALSHTVSHSKRATLQRFGGFATFAVVATLGAWAMPRAQAATTASVAPWGIDGMWLCSEGPHTLPTRTCPGGLHICLPAA